ncbi:MAG: hypothetical protein DDT19_01313 [Syntrophomonadaceae bacterium]|nr:hypothetical protein [Bacillota bacterium]
MATWQPLLFRHLQVGLPVFTFVLTDNGSEFKKHFSTAIIDLHLTHYHTRPRTPKQNAHSERFNRTVQEEFANYHRHDLWMDIESFNRKLVDWLLWYNTKRPNESLGMVSPLRYIVSTLTAGEYQSGGLIQCGLLLGKLCYYAGARALCASW